MEIKRIGLQPSAKGPSDWFTGAVRIDPLFQAPDPAFVQGASVTFEPGARNCMAYASARSNAHRDSRLRPRTELGGPIEEIRPGDVVWFLPGEKHWHGATPTAAMTHIAIQEKKTVRLWTGWNRSVTTSIMADESSINDLECVCHRGTMH